MLSSPSRYANAHSLSVNRQIKLTLPYRELTDSLSIRPSVYSKRDNNTNTIFREFIFKLISFFFDCLRLTWEISYIGS